MDTRYEYRTRAQSQRVADLKHKASALERELSTARESLEHELAEEIYAHDVYDRPAPPVADRAPAPHAHQHGTEDRTEILVNLGHPSAYSRRFTGGRRKAAIGGAMVIGLVIIMIVVLTSGGASWPASVARMQAQVSQACENQNVMSEPGQVNFACAKDTHQILWVFALLTSGGNADYASAKTGRVGLEPIVPSQGGQIAWSLNLHHPYSPASPIDSLQVGARAINNIIGGATLTGSNGKPVVEAGLESNASNCQRYTGSARLAKHTGFPVMCAKPVSTSAGQAALVADVYQRWMGATPQAAQDAAVLFQNAQNPGNPQVQAILKHLPQAGH
jgi:hypothetical protein